MNSPLFNEWVEEERKEAAVKAAKESTRKNIIDLLTEKFDFVPRSIRDNIDILDDKAILDELLKKIIRVGTLEEFNALLDKAKDI